MGRVCLHNRSGDLILVVCNSEIACGLGLGLLLVLARWAGCVIFFASIDEWVRHVLNEKGNEKHISKGNENVSNEIEIEIEKHVLAIWCEPCSVVIKPRLEYLLYVFGGC